MKEAVAKKWVAALRSGEYEQTQSTLVNNHDQFCCLGVLANIAPDSCGEWTNNYGHWCFEGSDGQVESCSTPRTVMKWAGLKTDNGKLPAELRTVNTQGGSTTLMGCNDSQKMNFDEIADVIEATWPGL